MRDDKENVIVTKSIEFSVAIIKYCEVLEQDKKFVISNQLLRSATSIGANIFEAQNAESKADFIHKMKIAAKETSETQYWLLLCERSETYKFDRKLKEQLDEINRILSKIISTAKGGLRSLTWFVLIAFSNFKIFKFSN
jgi:four helix bundle protein